MRAAVALVATLALFAAAGASPAADRADPSKLWQEYPLNPPPPPTRQDDPRPAEPSVTRPAQATITRAAVIEAPADENRISGIAAIIALLAGAFVVVTLIFFATRFLTDSLLLAVSATAKGVPAVSKLFRRHDHDDEHAESSQDERPEAEAETGRPVADLVTSYTAYRSTVAPPAESAEPAREPERRQQAAAVREREPEPAYAPPGPGKYADLGQRIADVLRVAEESSEQVLADARTEAQRLLAEAEEQAQDLRSRAERESQDRRAESERVRAEADAYAEQRKAKADEEAAGIRAEAESEARALREAGEEIRRRLEKEGIAKQKQLQAAAGAVELRLREALDTSRTVAAEIERLLNGSPQGADDATLAEALEVQQQRQ